MSLPDYQSLMLPVLKRMADRLEHPLSEIREQIATELKLSPEEIAGRLPTGQTIFANRIAWAIQFLKAAAILQSQRRGAYRITDRGILLLESNPAEITVKSLRRFPEFLEFAGGSAVEENEAGGSSAPMELKDTPEESMGRSFRAHQDALAEDLLEAIRNGTPAAFERLVVDLLLAMGYGGSMQNAGRVVGKSGDGGIDGEIDQDKLGMEKVYVQAKRWENVVGSPEIMRFSGGLTKKNAHKGIFITSSAFTRDAIDYVRALTQKIVLIDGKRLAVLMIEHNVGVSPERAYTLKRLDPHYFENLS